MRIKKQYIKYLLCLAPFLLSAIVYVQLNASFANILLFLKMIAFIYILCEHLRSMSLTKLDFSFAIYFFIWLFSIIINGESVIDYFKEAVVILSFVFLIENAFDNASDKYGTVLMHRKQSNNRAHFCPLLCFVWKKHNKESKVCPIKAAKAQ